MVRSLSLWAGVALWVLLANDQHKDMDTAISVANWGMRIMGTVNMVFSVPKWKPRRMDTESAVAAPG